MEKIEIQKLIIQTKETLKEKPTCWRDADCMISLK